MPRTVKFGSKRYCLEVHAIMLKLNRDHLCIYSVTTSVKEENANTLDHHVLKEAEFLDVPNSAPAFRN
jgi:hypothetical protein